MTREVTSLKNRLNIYDLIEENRRLVAENEDLKKNQGSLTLKVSTKGGVSLYGLQRFPVTLYKNQWLKLLSMAQKIMSFIKENDSQLKNGGLH